MRSKKRRKGKKKLPHDQERPLFTSFPIPFDRVDHSLGNPQFTYFYKRVAVS